MDELNLIIVAGASRGIGKTFLEEYKKQNNTICYGINRNGCAGEKLDLMDSNATYKFVNKLNLKEVSKIIYIHSIGTDKFEPEGKPHIDLDEDGIDDEVLSSNCSTFLNLAEPLIDKVRPTKIPMSICNIGSISDVFNVPYWQSFSRAKNKVRQFCKSTYETNINSIFLNISSTLDENHNTYGRKNIDTSYWQTSSELLEKSFSLLDNFHKMSTNYAEFDFFKFNPSFRPDYFTNLSKLYATWQRDLGFIGKEIPSGIRI